MRLIVSALAAILLAQPAPARSQDIDPVSVSPDKYKILLENDHVRVVEYAINPGDSDKPHTHPPKVSYVAAGGKLRINPGDAPSFISDDATGEVSFRGVTPGHFVTNIGTTPVKIVLFEIKRIDTDAVPAGQDPFRNNPATLSVKLENDSVRVMEAVIPPGYREKQHTHPPYVMYILNGGNVRMHIADGTTRDAELKTGDMLFSEKVTHWAENTGSSTIRVLLVEIRHKQAQRESR
jgi:quercetin dioxygenase-like cupin family protein